MQEPCEASIRIRSVSPESFETPCPFECTNGQGNCLEDWSMLLTVDPETLPKPPTEPSWRNIDDQLRCTCETTTGLTAEHTGRFCEAPLSNVDTQNDSPLQPGEWRAHRFNVDDLNPTDLNVELTVRNLTSAVKTAMFSAVCSADTSFACTSKTDSFK